MTTPLVKTKLYIPPVRPDRVARPHLLRRLNDGLCLGHKLTLVSAPAGFGKTTLLSGWLAALRTSQPGDWPTDKPVPQACWLSLDEGDNDPIRFLTYLIAALQEAHNGIGQDAGASFRTSTPQPSSAQELLAVCINQVDAVESQIVLVLDDYHLITSPEIHRALVYLLDHLPHNLHLVIATRADPPLALSRLRGRGQLTELRQADLSFSASEVASYVTQVMGLELSPEDVAALASRTEGWVTGLQMAALAVQRRDVADASAFLATLSGRHEHIVDYFADEVLGRQSDGVQTFLLQTSILERLSGPLCDAVCDLQREDVDQESGQRVLERLQEANLFVVALDDERRWYRYHRLFADLLRQRLLQGEPALIPELHRRASRWYEQHGFIEPSIDHALRGGDLDRAALLIEQAAEAILMRSELVTLKTWFGALPQKVVRQRPLLCLYYAGVLLLTGAPQDGVQACLKAAARHDIAGTAAHGATILRALLALWQGDVAQSVRLGQQALASLPEQNLFWRSIVTGNLGIAYLYHGIESELAEHMLEQAADLGERVGNVMGAVIALCNLAELRIVQGQLGAANKLYDRALALATDSQGQRLPIGGMAVVGAAGLLLEWDDLEEAERLLASAFDLHSEKLPLWAADGYLTLARLRQSQGDGQAAQDAIDRARGVAASTRTIELDDWVVAVAQARLWIAQGSLDAAEDWARRRWLVGKPAGGALDADSGHTLYALYELERLALAELWLAQDKPRDALDGLATLLDRSCALRRTDTAIKAMVLVALAHRQLNERDQALAALAQALALARPGGYVRTFVDRGPPMAHLLRQALVQGLAVDDVQRLLSAFGPNAVPSTRRQELVEPFSERELQVLRLLAASLSSAEIAAELYVSVNTVRFHLKNIYSKLNVHNREDAMQRAKELGLL